MVLGGIKTGFGLVARAVRVFRHHPRLVVPLAATWVCIAILTIWARFFRPELDFQTVVLLAFGVIFLQALLLALSCSVLLEMVEQIERGESPSIRTALADTVGKNLLSLLPLVVVWSIIWFVLSVIAALVEDDSGGDEEYSAQNAARALSGGPTSWLGAGIDALQKGVRMLVFLVIPAIAWEDRSFWGAINRGVEVFRENVAAFATGFSLTYLIATTLFLPVAILFELVEMEILWLTSTQWYLVTGYIGLAWSFTIYLEQMFVALLFLWNKEFEQAVAAAEREGRDPPSSIREVPHPSLLDDVASLEERKLPGGGSAPIPESGARNTE